ncbi:TPA: hypothetical protein ACG4BS_005333, partial [Escherichia coli]
ILRHEFSKCKPPGIGYTARVNLLTFFSSPPLTRRERIKALVEKQVVLFQCPGWSGNGQNN